MLLDRWTTSALALGVSVAVMGTVVRLVYATLNLATVARWLIVRHARFRAFRLAVKRGRDWYHVHKSLVERDLLREIMEREDRR